MSIDMQTLKHKFQERQYKLTPQRQTILQTFLEHPDRHLSAEEVYDILRGKSLDIGIATVYRTLELFSELNILHKLNFDDGRHRYEMNESSSTHHHHHLICLECGKVIEFEDDLLEPLESQIAQKSNFTIVNHQVKFYGYCEACRKSD